MAEIDEFDEHLLLDDQKSLVEAVKILHSQLDDLTKEVIPNYEKMINLSDKHGSVWRQRALLAESRVKLLERQLEEKNHQTNQYKSSYEGQYQLMMKTGATLNEVLWKSFKSHENVKMLVQAEETMAKFCALTRGIVDSFLVAYRTALPPLQSLEHDFVISVFGALTNFAAFTEGRTYLASQDNGLQLVKKLVIEQEHWNAPHGRYIKRMVLTFAYNMTLVENVAYFLLSDETFIDAILKCLGLSDATDVVAAAVTIIYRLVAVSFEAEIPSVLPEKIPWSLIRSLSTSTDSQLGETCRSFLDFFKMTAPEGP